MAKQKRDELEDFDDVSESMYFVPDQYIRQCSSVVHSNRQSTLPVEGPNISGTLTKTHLWWSLPTLLTIQQAKHTSLLLACKLSSLCVILSPVISLSNS